MEITKLAQYNDGKGLLTSQVFECAEKNHQRILTNLEIDERLVKTNRWESEKEMYPCWTSTHIKYDAKSGEALVWNEGEKKQTKISFPLKRGWYLTEKKYGIPNGTPSDSSNADARYLWRFEDSSFDGLVSRFYDWYGYGRYVSCCHGDDLYRFGVLATERAKRAKSSDKALIWLTKMSKKNKNAKEILKRLSIS
jgi:hypothetical protein